MTAPSRGSSATVLVGAAKDAIDTPALLVDLDVLDGNIGRIAAICRQHGVRWRPHIKGQKVPQIVWRQIEAGAKGITCAKLSEAEVMADAGIDDILIANQIVGDTKVDRLIALRRRVAVMTAVDNIDNVVAIGRAAVAAGVIISVVIEVDIGMKRAGVQPGAATIELAENVTCVPGVKLAGLMAWEGHVARIEDAGNKRLMVEEAVGLLVQTADAIRNKGIPVEIVSCGGTGTYPITAAIKGVTEIQAGGGIFSDIAYRTLYQIDHPPALTVLSTVTSRSVPTRIICDAGKKSMSGDTALPAPMGIDHVRSIRLSAEHAIIELAQRDDTPRIGDKLEFVVGYADTTVHLHEELYVIRDGRVVDVWPITGRGKVR